MEEGLKESWSLVQREPEGRLRAAANPGCSASWWPSLRPHGGKDAQLELQRREAAARMERGLGGALCPPFARECARDLTSRDHERAQRGHTSLPSIPGGPLLGALRAVRTPGKPWQSGRLAVPLRTREHSPFSPVTAHVGPKPGAFLCSRAQDNARGGSVPPDFGAQGTECSAHSGATLLRLIVIT